MYWWRFGFSKNFTKPVSRKLVYINSFLQKAAINNWLFKFWLLSWISNFSILPAYYALCKLFLARWQNDLPMCFVDRWEFMVIQHILPVNLGFVGWERRCSRRSLQTIFMYLLYSLQILKHRVWRKVWTCFEAFFACRKRYYFVQKSKVRSNIEKCILI